MSSPAKATLGIELSQRSGSVALRPAPEAPILHMAVDPPSDHRDALMPAIDAIVRGAALQPADIALVALSAGPGGFTGLRISFATAKSLWLGLGAPIVTVPSALVVAHTLAGRGRMPDGTHAVALVSKGATAWLEVVRVEGGHPHREVHGLFDAATAPLNGVASLAADRHLPVAWMDRVQALGIPVVGPEWSARSCVVLGEQIVRTAGPSDPFAIAPIYPRPPEAVTLWEGRAGRAASAPG